ncbi:hypothetical protein EMCRGX_G034960 [Ephydatia muelleri]
MASVPPTPNIPPPSAAPCLPPYFDITALLHSFPKDTACGPSGLRIQHLIEAAEVPLQFPICAVLRDVVKLLISGKVPVQVARQAVLDACDLHFPELLPWSSWCYGQHPALWHPLGTITSEIGVQQGDPLGPLLFCLVLQQVVSTIAEDAVCASLLFHKWYIDDGVAGPIAAIARVLAIIQDCGPPLRFTSTSPSDQVFCAKFVAQKQSETSSIKEAFALFDDHMQQCFSECTAVDASASTLHLAAGTTEFKEGGGLRAKAPIMPLPCSILQSSGLFPLSGKYLSSSVDLYNSLVDPQDSLTPELVGNSHLSQKALSSKIEDQQFEFQVALKWWLGIPVVQGQSCPHCPSFVLDDFGHHSLSCKHGGDVVSRHNKLRDVFLDFCQRACLGPRLEMGCGAGYTSSQSRPADVLVPNWDLGKPAAFDLSITTTLHPSVLLEVSMTAGSAALVAENRKHKYNDRKCEEPGWVCIPLVVETYGCWGAAAVAALSKLAGRLSTRLNQPKSKTIFGIYSRLGLALVRANCRAILSRLT